MHVLLWIFILVAVFAVLGARDLVGFFRVGPAGRRRYLLWLLVVVWLAGLAGIFYYWPPGSLNPGMWSIRQEPCWSAALVFTIFMVLMMGLTGSLRVRGSGRTYAIAWMSFREAMSQRAWLAIPLWLVGVLVVGIFVSPYRLVQDRMMLSTLLLVRGQLLMAGVLMLTLACRSIPRELDKRTIMVTASKPISMLELVVGKLLGLILLGALLAGAMGLCSYAVLWYEGQQVRRQARIQLHAQEQAYQEGTREVEPDSDLREIARRGVLYARDPVWPRDTVAFNGKFDEEIDQRACLKGGSNAGIQWRFENLEVSERLPVLYMNFGIERDPREITKKNDFDPAAPLIIKLKGISIRDPRLKVEMEVPLPVSADMARVGLSRPIGGSTGVAIILDPNQWGVLYNIGPVGFDVRCEVEGHYLYFANESLRLGSVGQGGFGRPEALTVASESGRAVLVAKRFRNAYEISGVEIGQPAVAYWHFKDVDLSDFPPGGNVSFDIQTYQEKSDVIKSYTVGLVRALSIRPDGKKDGWPIPGQDEEVGPDESAQQQNQQKLLDRDWPGWKQVVVRERKPTSVDLPRRLFAEGNDVYVFLACGTGTSGIELTAKSGYLSRGSSSFALNLLRCEAIVFMQLATIAAVAVMASSFLSWPVACFLSIVIYLIGAAGSFIREQITLWGTGAAVAAHYVIKGLLVVLPNFSIYQATEKIAEGDLIPVGKLSELFGLTCLWVVGSALLAYLLLRSRELAK